MTVTRLDTNDYDAVSAADKLVPIIQQRAEATEDARSVVKKNIEDLKSAGLFRMGVPKYLGGH